MTAKERLERIKQYYSSIESLIDALISYSEKTGIDLEQLIEKVVDEND